nr:ribosome biogenesis GTPase YlqF [[Clostridium] polysaccharolyticum]
MMNFQWYPGHMTKAKRQMQEDVKLIDVVIELVDARIPFSSKNPDIDHIAKNKSRIVLLNKFDLADEKNTMLWKEWFEKQGFFAALVNSKNGKGVKEVHNVIQQACKEKIERDRKRGIINRPVRAMIVGIPNVGKSTFINSFAGKACAKTGNRPGVTKGKQWIRLNKNVELLDTPGILWPKFEDQAVGLRLAFIGSIKDEILNITELSLELIAFLQVNYQGFLAERYGIDETQDKVKVLEEIAAVRGCRLKGNELDYEKAASLILDEFRNGKIGRVTLEFPQAD